MQRSEVFDLIDRARKVCDEKWTSSGCDGVWLDNPHEGVTVLLEEVGEVARAVLEKDFINLQDELVDVAQVVVAWLESFV